MRDASFSFLAGWVGKAVAGLALAWGSFLTAEEGGAGHYAPGSIATLIDLPPVTPGWTVNPLYLYFDGEVSGSRNLPLAGLLTSDIEATSHSVTLGALYTLPEPVLGAWFSVGAYVPYVWIDVEASIGDLRADDSVDGIGDISVVPAMFAWQDGNWQYNAFLNVYAPTGDYEVGALANTGLNYWTFQPVVGVANMDGESGFNWSVHGGATFNTRNDDTDYESGSVVHLDASVQQALPLGDGVLTVGAIGFYYEQVTGDSGSGAQLGDFEGRSIGVGPTLGYLLQAGEDTLMFELRWLPELDTRRRIEGDYLWLKAVWQFSGP